MAVRHQHFLSHFVIQFPTELLQALSLLCQEGFLPFLYTGRRLAIAAQDTGYGYNGLGVEGDRCTKVQRVLWPEHG